MSKEVAFNVHGVVYVAEDPTQADPLEREVKVLGELLNEIKDEQEYIVIREQVHRNTAESTNSRVKWWSIFQLGVVGGNGVFQVWYLKRFFEVCCILFWGGGGLVEFLLTNLAAGIVGQEGCLSIGGSFFLFRVISEYRENLKCLQ